MTSEFPIKLHKPRWNRKTFLPLGRANIGFLEDPGQDRGSGTASSRAGRAGYPELVLQESGVKMVWPLGIFTLILPPFPAQFLINKGVAGRPDPVAQLNRAAAF
jgi:hypothetical protein